MVAGTKSQYLSYDGVSGWNGTALLCIGAYFATDIPKTKKRVLNFKTLSRCVGDSNP